MALYKFNTTIINEYLEPLNVFIDSSNLQIDKQLAIYEALKTYNYNILSSGRILSDLPIFYIYGYLRSRTSKNGEAGTFYYIGKGSNGRITESHRVPIPKNTTNRVYILQNLTEYEAFNIEIFLILFYGRIDNNTGILRNLTNGGDGAYGRIHSDITKKKIGIGNKGKIISDETKQKMSELAKNRPPISDDIRQKMSESKKGDKSPCYGQKLPDEIKQKIKDTIAGMIYWNNGKINTRSKKCPGEDWIAGRLGSVSDETRIKLKIANLGKKVWNNGVTTVSAFQPPGDDWVLGKLYKHSNETRKKLSTKGMTYWNNGVINTRSYESPGPEWSPGKLISEKFISAMQDRNKNGLI